MSLTPLPHSLRFALPRRGLLAGAGLLLSALIAPIANADQPGSSPLQVYVLAGQSNMAGRALLTPASTIGTLDYVVANDPTSAYQFVSDGNGGYASFSDVWIHYEETTSSFIYGDLDASYGGSGSTRGQRLGPELGFGYAIGQHHGEQVLLIKTAWGGKSLAVDFRPPSAGGETGFYYEEIVRIVNQVTSNIETYFPDYDETEGYELAGFGWHQGWNDHSNAAHTAEYEENLAHFIQDIRKDLGSPLPFVVATTGMASRGDGDSAIEAAQRAVGNASDYPEFVGNVGILETTSFWRDPSESPIPNGTQNYHWNQHAGSMLDIGLGMAELMTTLSPQICPASLRAESDASGVTLTWLNGIETPLSVQILRNGEEIASSAPADSGTYLDTTATPGVLNYELVFTMPTTACDPLTVTHDTCISNFDGTVTNGQVLLTWENKLAYEALSLSRNGTILDNEVAGSAESYLDTNPPASGLVTYTIQPTTGDCPPATVEVNLSSRVIDGPILFADTFNRANGTDLNASTTGQSGTLGTLTYGTGTFGSTTLDLNSNGIRSNGPAASGSFGGLVYLADHNFVDEAITAGGGFSVTVDLTAYSTAGSGRQMSIGVGQALSDLQNQSGVDPSEHASDLLVAYKATTGDLNIYKNGVLDASESVAGDLPAAPTTLRVEYLCDSFEGGATVLYSVFFDEVEGAFAAGTFTWSGTEENYFCLSSNLSNDSRFDNLEIQAGTPRPVTDYESWSELFPTADLSDGSGDFDDDGLSNDEERIWGLDPTNPSSASPFLTNLSPTGAISYTRRSTNLTGLSYQVMTSTDLVEWNEDTGATQSIESSSENGVEIVLVESLSQEGDSERLFIKIQAVE